MENTSTADADFPDVRKQLSQIVQSLRMNAFPRVLWRFADAHAALFVPTRAGATGTREVVSQLRNDPAFRHWICENATLEQVTYCRLGLHLLGEQFEHNGPQELQNWAKRIMLRPMFVPIVDTGLSIAQRVLKT